MDALRLRFANRKQPDLVLAPGVHAIGRDSLLQPILVDNADYAIAQFCVDRRGVWLQVRDGVRGLYVNGRPVRRMAMLRAGDAVYFDGVELILLGADPLPAPANSSPDGDLRMVLRGVGGVHHGRCFSLDQPRLVGRVADADIRVSEPVFADRHARLEPHADGVVLRDLGSHEGSVVNGHPVRHALLRPGDQVAFDAQNRFVVEAPMARAALTAVPTRSASEEQAEAASELAAASALPNTVRRIPWLLLAAVLLAGALSLLLLYGAR